VAYSARPTIRTRILGKMLKTAREGAGLTAAEVEEKLGISKPTLYRYESGHTTPKKVLIWPLCDLYGIDKEERIRRLEEWAERAKNRTPLGEASNVGPTYTDYADAESLSTALRTWEPYVIPGLLQTTRTSEEAISRGLLAQPGQPLVGSDVVAGHLALRETRKKLLEAEVRPQVWAIIGEAAIMTPPAKGDTDAHREQIQHLLNVGETKASIQILPFSSGMHAGLSGSFTILTVVDVEMAHREGYGDGIFVEDEEQVAIYRARYERLQSEALTVPESRRYLHDFLGRL
jgi:transcriptional regulator with XRE-family HTH domain